MKDEKLDVELTGEDNVDDIEIEELESKESSKTQKLKKQLKECEKERMEHLENLQRAKAEFLNAKKRLEEQKTLDNERTIVTHVEKLLPLCDSFEMAMSNKEAWEAIDETWRKGVLAIQAQLQSILTGYGVTIVNPAGETFDPEKHEAMSTVDHEEAEEGTIVEVLQSGYERNGELIRPAKVILSN